MNKKLTFNNLFYLFMFGNVGGWVLELIFTLLKKGTFINHSSLIIGPIDIVYGFSVIVLCYLLQKYENKNIFKVFVFSFCAGTVIEYFTSFIMEQTSGFTAWDYSHKFLNINGRVSLFYSLCWGTIGVVWTKLLQRRAINSVQKIPDSFSKKFIPLCSAFLVLDLVFSMSVLNRCYLKEINVEPRNKIEELYDKYISTDYLDNMYNNTWKRRNR